MSFRYVATKLPDYWPRIHVATDHGAAGSGDAAEAISAEDVAVDAGHLRWARSL